MKSKGELEHEKNKIVEGALAKMQRVIKPEDEGQLESLRKRSNEIVGQLQQQNNVRFQTQLMGTDIDSTLLANVTSKYLTEHFHKWSKEELLLLIVMLFTMQEVIRVSGRTDSHKIILPP